MWYSILLMAGLGGVSHAHPKLLLAVANERSPEVRLCKESTYKAALSLCCGLLVKQQQQQ